MASENMCLADFDIVIPKLWLLSRSAAKLVDGR